MKLDLTTMLKATLSCFLLTLGWYFCIRPLPARIDYFRELELIAVWIILLTVWIVFFQTMEKQKVIKTAPDIHIRCCFIRKSFRLFIGTSIAHPEAEYHEFAGSFGKLPVQSRRATNGRPYIFF